MPFECVSPKAVYLPRFDSRHGGVVAREVAHVQFVDGHVGLRLDGVGCAVRVPAARLEGRGVEVGDVAALRVGGEADRVRVGDEVAHQARAWGHDIDRVSVVAAREVGGHAGAPRAGARVEGERVDGAGAAAAAVVDADGHVLRARRPQPEAGALVCRRRAEVGQVARGGVQVVEGAGRLQACRLDDGAVGGFLHEHELLTVQLTNARQVGILHGQHGPGADVLEALRRRRRHRAGKYKQVERSRCALHPGAVCGGDRTGRRMIEAEAALAGRAGPFRQPPVEPDGARFELLGGGVQDRREGRAVAGLQRNGRVRGTGGGCGERGEGVTDH
jgi:hypothetical protein